MKTIVAVIDPSGSEAIYVDGRLHPIEGNTIFASDLIDAADDKPVMLRGVTVEDSDESWPEKLADLKTVDE